MSEAMNDVMTDTWDIMLGYAVEAYQLKDYEQALYWMGEAKEAATGQPEALQACQDIENTWAIPGDDDSDDDEPDECSSCAGTGELYERRCRSCGGNGYICRASDDYDGPDDYCPDIERDIYD